MKRIIFTILTCLAVFFWGGFLSGWRMMADTRLFYDGYLVYTPYFTSMRYSPSDNQSALDEKVVIGLSYDGIFATTELDELLWQADNDRQREGLYYDQKNSCYYRLVRYAGAGLDEIQISTLDENFQVISRTPRVKNYLEGELVKIKLMIKHRESGEEKEIECFALLQSAFRLADEQSYYPLIKQTTHNKYEVISKHPVELTLFMHPSRYMSEPSLEGRLSYILFFMK